MMPTWNHSSDLLPTITWRCRALRRFLRFLSSCRAFLSFSGPICSGAALPSATSEETFISVSKELREGAALAVFMDLQRSFCSWKWLNELFYVKPHPQLESLPCATGFWMTVSTRTLGFGWSPTKQPRLWRTNTQIQWGTAESLVELHRLVMRIVSSRLATIKPRHWERNTSGTTKHASVNFRPLLNEFI